MIKARTIREVRDLYQRAVDTAVAQGVGATMQEHGAAMYAKGVLHALRWVVEDDVAFSARFEERIAELQEALLETLGGAA